MDRKEVYSSLAAIIAELLDLPSIDLAPQTALDELGLDSVERVELLSRLEEAFDIEIPQSDAIHLTTVDALARYLSCDPSA